LAPFYLHFSRLSTFSFVFPLVSKVWLFLISLGLVTWQNLSGEPTASGTGVPANSTNPATAEPRFRFIPVHVSGPYVALTFDDGPNPETTPKLLDLLAAHHAKATFFVIGKRVVQYPQIFLREVHEGHEIGNHSWSHPRLLEISDPAVREELQKADAVIRKVTGVSPVLMRPPGGALSVRQAQWIEREFGYRTILWDVHGFDWIRPSPSPEAIAERIVEGVHPGAVIVCHDTLPTTIEAIPAILSQLEAKQFKFVTVSELLRLGTADASRSDPK
jgi:peptidoglycan/xylan/chitin deacetylase (PgdA/CDA1 family)